MSFKLEFISNSYIYISLYVGFNFKAYKSDESQKLLVTSQVTQSPCLNHTQSQRLIIFSICFYFHHLPLFLCALLLSMSFYMCAHGVVAVYLLGIL